ncbi:hypothetical protein FRC09_009741, partial [Ceratobasidium sp. 395]
MASRQRITVQDVSDSDSDGERRVATLPNTGARGALLQEIGDASDPDEPSLEFLGSTASASSSAPFRAQHTQYRPTAADVEKYKR